MIPYGRQSISEADIDAVVQVLRSDFLTQGPVVPQFEQAISRYTKAQHAVSVNSGTSALHLACLALDLGKEDIVWTSPITFVASANCALYCGARVDFVDINPHSFNLCPQTLEAKLIQAEQLGQLPKIVIPVHLGGLSCDMQRIYELSKRYGFFIIEDACHAIGGRYHNEPIGNCRYSDITVFSFHPVKNMTAGEGGMVTTNNSLLAEKMQLLRSHGISRDPDKLTHSSHGPWYYQQLQLGFNYRMTDIHAALGISQLKRLDDFIQRRHKIASLYNHCFATDPVQPQHQAADSYSALHLYILRLNIQKIGKPFLQVFQAMRDAGILVNVHYIPVPSQPYYQALGFKARDFPQAEQYYLEAISLPMYPDLTEEHLDYVVQSLQHIIN